MSAPAAIARLQAHPTTRVAARTPAAERTITWKEFQSRYLRREDMYKYEWVDGKVEKTPRAMGKNQIYIFKNLLRFLYTLKAKNPRIIGDLITETDTFFIGNHRRPDIAFFTDEQIESARRDENIVPKFVIEIISKNDQSNRVGKKMADYWAAGVEVIWHIYPQLNRIDVYHGRKMTVCLGDDICSAEPVIEGFLISVNDVLR